MSEPRQVITVDVSLHTQWGDPQQVGIDRLLYASGTLAPEVARDLLDAIRAAVKPFLNIAPLSEGSWKALDALLKQVSGVGCQVSGKEADVRA